MAYSTELRYKALKLLWVVQTDQSTCPSLPSIRKYTLPELVGVFNSRLSTLSDSAQERFIEFVIDENAK